MHQGRFSTRVVAVHQGVVAHRSSFQNASDFVFENVSNVAITIHHTSRTVLGPSVPLIRIRERLGIGMGCKAGPISELPEVQLLRLVGLSPALWRTEKLPLDFGGWERQSPHGMAGLDAMALARTNLEVLHYIKIKHEKTNESHI